MTADGKGRSSNRLGPASAHGHGHGGRGTNATTALQVRETTCKRPIGGGVRSSENDAGMQRDEEWVLTDVASPRNRIWVSGLSLDIADCTRLRRATHSRAHAPVYADTREALVGG